MGTWRPAIERSERFRGYSPIFLFILPSVLASAGGFIGDTRAADGTRCLSSVKFGPRSGP